MKRRSFAGRRVAEKPGGRSGEAVPAVLSFACRVVKSPAAYRSSARMHRTMLNRAFATLSVLSIAVLGCTSEEPSENTSEPTTSISSKSPTDSEGTAQPDEAVEEEDQTMVGGYSKASVDDANVMAAAEFAVAEESKKGTKFGLKSIYSAETQVVAGTNYKLVMIVDEGDTEKTVEVVVYEDLRKSLSVASWTVK